MKNGVCPKCQSREVYSGAQLKWKSGIHSVNSIPVNSFRLAPLDNYVCGQCAYVESYIAKESDLSAIKKKWPVV